MPEPPRVAQVLAGDARAAARLMRDLDDGRPTARLELRSLLPHAGRAALVGITGSPGVGKSSLVDALIVRYRAAGRRVGVVAVDPTSPLSGGALLGDRVRMQRHATDPGVFIRSLATRGQLGGLSRSTGEVASVLDAAGFDPVLIETVGVGQAEVDVAGAADAVVVVTAPGLGDEVQALKAGLLEVADVLVVNKADREGADRAVRDLETMLALRNPPRPVEIVRAVAVRGDGIEALEAAIARVLAAPTSERQARRRRRAEQQIVAIVADLARAALGGGARDRDHDSSDPRQQQLLALVDDVAAGRQDAYTAAEIVAAGLLARP